MSFTFRLDRYRGWLTDQREEVERSIQACRAEYQKAVQRLQQRQFEYAQYVDQLQHGLETGLQPCEIDLYKTFIDQANSLIHTERGVISQIEERLSLLMDTWRDFRQREKMLNKLFEKRRMEHQKALLQQEQRQFDELAALKGGEFNWKTS